MEPVIKKSVKNKNVFYVLNWSRLIEADRHEIMRSVPSVSGIFELYYKDIKNQMCLFFVSMSWYGGLRNSIREKTDLEIETDKKRREIIEKYDIYFRNIFSGKNTDGAFRKI